MSHLLFRYYWENDVDRFRRLLAPVGHSHSSYTLVASRSPGGGGASSSGIGGGNPASAALGSSPRVAKPRRPGLAANHLSKNDVNGRDHAGLTVLLRAASSTSATAVKFVEALLDHPGIDIYVTDTESGWNALHRALYNGNISIARLLLEKETRDLIESLGPNTITKVGQLIKTKDSEGNSPFDLYNASIATRPLRLEQQAAGSDNDSDRDEDDFTEVRRRSIGLSHTASSSALGDEVFMWGSNRNLMLGLGDEDDRVYPEILHLKRPEPMIQYLHDEFLKRWKDVADHMLQDTTEVTTLVRNAPVYVQDVAMAKLSAAILTTDPMSNLFVTGIGRGGRLGLGDDETRFTFTPFRGVLADRKVQMVALGLNHSMACTENGELWTWGSNADGQLGYTLPSPMRPGEESTSLTPRQVFGPLKKEVVLGVAASSIHSVAWTSSSLFCWGRNEGQLALMDADSRSLEIQAIPRRVAASLLSSHSSIAAVSAINRAMTCLFGDHTVCVFTNYGYAMIKFDGFSTSSLQNSRPFSMSSRYEPGRREIGSIASGGETIVALTKSGDVFTLSLNKKADRDLGATSTTNPSKIKDAVTQPQLVWTSKKDGAKSVAVAEDDSIILATKSGAVWRRIRRTQAHDRKLRKDWKFQRVPCITGVITVRSSAFGAFCAIRKDCDVTRDQIQVDGPSLWHDMGSLCLLRGFEAKTSGSRQKDIYRSQIPKALEDRVGNLAYEVLSSENLEEDLAYHLRVRQADDNDASLKVLSVSTSSTPNLRIPCHPFVLTARSPVIRAGWQQFREVGHFEIPELLTMYQQDNGVSVIQFMGMDLISLLNLVTYSYSDGLIPAWSFTRQAPSLAYRFRQIRIEIMKVATKLGLADLENAVRVQGLPRLSMNIDYRKTLDDPAYLEDGDVLLELDGEEVPAHSALLCKRCPWFDGIFNGYAKGSWLDGRRSEPKNGLPSRISIDLKHVNPDAFYYVLQYLYADVGDELFAPVTMGSIDEFAELVVEVLLTANELMLFRLSQICQKVLGQFVTARNISTMLNLISPCTVTEFKDKGLEYICLQLEYMLENHLLDNLDESLMLELDQAVRANQLARCPFVRSGRADMLLHERYPELVADIEEERQVRLRALAYRYRINAKEEERKLSSSFKPRFGSVEDFSGTSPVVERTRGPSKILRDESSSSPALQPRDSQTDFIFDMDEEELVGAKVQGSESTQPTETMHRSDLDQLSTLSSKSLDRKGKGVDRSSLPNTTSDALPPRSLNDVPTEAKRVPSGGNPWHSAVFPTARLGLREIMTQSQPQSALSASLAAEKKQAVNPAPQKMSQRRKKQLQLEAEQAAREDSQASQAPSPWTKVAVKTDSPWQQQQQQQQTSPTNKVAPAPLMKEEVKPDSQALAAAPKSTAAAPSPRRMDSPDTRFSGQSRSGASTPRSAGTQRNQGGSRIQTAQIGPSSSLSQPQPQAQQSQSITSGRIEAKSQAQAQGQQPLVPHSKSYIPKPPKYTDDSLLGIGLADIIGQQQREQEIVREAAAKRSLAEIQQEQAFQEWWDQESRRTQEEETRKANLAGGRREREKEKDQNRGRRARRGGKAKEVEKGQEEAERITPGPSTSGRGIAGASSRNEQKDSGLGRGENASAPRNRRKGGKAGESKIATG